jgi:GR25 family glycosyltransferase involved in LPS biosynthesis
LVYIHGASATSESFNYIRSKLGAGVDINYDSRNGFENNLKDMLFFPRKSGQLGIYFSFLTALRDFLDTEFEVLFVLEDDFSIEQEFKNKMDLLLYKGKNMDWDMIKCFSFKWENRYFIRRYGHGPLVPVFTSHSTAAFCISRSGAKKVFRDLLVFGIRTPMDWYLWNKWEDGDPGTHFESLEISPFYPKIGELIADSFNSTIEVEKHTLNE